MPAARRAATEMEASCLTEATRANDTPRLDRPILLFVSDRAVLSSLKFALMFDGFMPESGSVEGADPFAARGLVIDQRYRADGLSFLQELQAAGVRVPVVLLTTNATQQLRDRAAFLDAVVIEKPLLGNELTEALRAILARDATV